MNAMALDALADTNLSEIEREYLAYLASAAIAKLTIKWIKKGMDMSPRNLADFCTRYVANDYSIVLGVTQKKIVSV
jgi:hypothetical protein